jgi:hypothetical protein
MLAHKYLAMLYCKKDIYKNFSLRKGLKNIVGEPTNCGSFYRDQISKTENAEKLIPGIPKPSATTP